MQVTLQVAASVRIKRKKPWSRLAWIGQDKESVLLLEDHRASILYVPSGKTKRKVPKLHPLLKDCVSLNHTRSGSIVFGLLASGSVFLWHKDSNSVSHTLGLPDLKARATPSTKWRPLVFADDRGRLVLAVVTSSSTPEVFLCERPTENATSDLWWRFGADAKVPRFGAFGSGKELAVDACFLDDPHFGRGVQCLFIYSSCAAVNVVALHVTFQTNCASSLVHQWSDLRLPAACLSPMTRPLSRHGAYVVRWSRDGRLAAVFVNQTTAGECRVLYVSVHCEVVVASRLPFVDFAQEDEVRRRHHWVCDAAWTSNDLFLVAINRLGFVCLLSKLGEPMTISTRGCSMDLRPAQSLAIHPLVYVRKFDVRNADDSVTTTTESVLKQRFSVTCHPRLPVILCSDGYLVTCLQLPKLLSDSHPAVYVYLREAHMKIRHLGKLLKVPSGHSSRTLATSSNKSKVADNSGSAGLTAQSEDTIVMWEVTPPELLQTVSDNDDDQSADRSARLVHRQSAIGNADHGILSFEMHDSTSQCPQDGTGASSVGSCDTILDLETEALACLTAAWSIVVTTPETWTVEWETRSKNVAELLVKLCATRVLNHPSVKPDSRITRAMIAKVTSVLDRFLLVSRFDFMGKNTLPVIISVLKSVVGMVLKVLRDTEPHAKLDGVVYLTAFLASAQDAVQGIFSWNRGRSMLNLSSNGRRRPVFKDFYVPSLLARPGVESCVEKADVGQRLASIWRRLYRVARRLYRMDVSDVDMPRLHSALGHIQAALHDAGQPLESARPVEITAEQRRCFLVPNDREAVISKWWQEAERRLLGESCASDKRLSELLHAILYLHLEGYRLREAVKYVERLLSLGRWSDVLSLRKTVRTFARFVAHCFLGVPLFIHPWHRPRPLPRLGKAAASRAGVRLVPLDRSRVLESAQAGDVGCHWSIDVPVALLLATGCVAEAAELTGAVGDRKSAFVLGVAQTLLRSGDSSTVPRGILLQHLMSVLTVLGEPEVTDDGLSRSLEDCFLATALCNLNVLLPIVKWLAAEFRRLVQRLDGVLVPEGIYLPRPPIYCPQLKDPSTGEDHVVMRISAVLRLIHVVLSSSRCVVPVVYSYVAELSRVARLVTLDGGRPPHWPLEGMTQRLDSLLQTGDMACDLSCPELGEITECFRNVCTLSWLLHVRDKASRQFRRFRRCVDDVTAKAHKPKAVFRVCLEALQWMVRLLPFAEFMGWNLEVYELIFSVLLEAAPADRRASAVLARCFPDMSAIPDELDYRFRRLLSVWHGIAIDMRTGRRGTHGSFKAKRPGLVKTLSVVHVEQCREMKRLLDELQSAVGAFEEDVFADGDRDADCPATAPTSELKVRPFEVDRCYYEFMELLLDVGFLKDVGSSVSMPLLPSSGPHLVDKHLAGISTDVGVSARVKRGVVVDVNQNLVATATSHVPLRKGGTKRGLFRSLSLDDLQSQTKAAAALSLPGSPSHVATSALPHGSPSKLAASMSRNSFEDRSRRLEDEIVACRQLLKEHALVQPPSSNLVFLCEACAQDQMSRCSDPRKDALIRQFVWLVRWSETDDCVTGVTDGVTPGTKVHLSVALVLSAMWDAWNVPLARSPGFESSSGNYSPTDVTPREFTASTPINHRNLDSGSSRHSEDAEPVTRIDSPASLSLSPSLQSSRNPDDLLSKYFRQLRRYVDSDASEGSSKFDSSTLGISPLPSDASAVRVDVIGRPVGDARTANNDKFGKADVESPSTMTTSKWTSSNGVPNAVVSEGIGGLNLVRVLQELQNPESGAPPQQSTVHRPSDGVHSAAASTKEVACGDVAAWPSVANACVQVHNVSLIADDADTYNSHRRRGHSDRRDRDDDTLDGVSSPEPTASCLKPGVGRSHLTRQKPVKRARRRRATPEGRPRQAEGRRPDDTPFVESDFLRDFSHVRVLRLPAEKEYCLLEPVILQTVSGRRHCHRGKSSRKKVDRDDRRHDLDPSIDPQQLLQFFNKPHIPSKMFQKRYADATSAAKPRYREKREQHAKETATPMVQPERLQDIVDLRTPTVSKESRVHHEGNATVEKKQRSAWKSGASLISVAVGTVGGRLCDAGTNTVERGAITANASVCTDVAGVSVGVFVDSVPAEKREMLSSNNKSHVSVATVDRASSPEVSLERGEKAVQTFDGAADSQREFVAVRTSSMSTQHQMAPVNLRSQITQTDAVSRLSKGDPSTRDAHVNTDNAEVQLGPGTDTTTLTVLENDAKSHVDVQEDNDDPNWWTKLDHAGQCVYHKLEAVDNMTKLVQDEMVDTKKFLQRLERLEQVGIVNRPSKASNERKIEPEERENGERHQDGVPDTCVNDYVLVREATNPKSASGVDAASQKDATKNELREWMRKKSLRQHREFKSKLDELRSLERQPFAFERPPVTNREIAKMEEERRHRRHNISVAHYLARTEEAMQLLKDLVQDQVPSTVSTRSPSSRNNRPPSHSSDAHHDIRNQTYVLDKGLVPVTFPGERFPDKEPACGGGGGILTSHRTLSVGSWQGRRHGFIEHRNGVLSSLSDERRATSSRNRPNTRDEMCVSTMGAAGTTAKLNSVLRKGASFLKGNPSPSSSWESLSSWSVPDEVQKILYNGNSHNSKKVNGHKKNDYSSGPSSEDSSISWSEVNRILR